MSIFTVNDSNPYITYYERVDNLEDVGEHFITQEEMDEIGARWGGVYNKPLIRKDLKALIKSIPDKQKSVKIPQQLEQAASHYDISAMLGRQGVRISGGRIYNKPVEQKIVRKSDFISLRSEVHHILKNNVMFSKDDPAASVTLMKKLVTWKQVAAEFKHYKDERGNTKFVKMLWDNPELAKR